jgi:hypothetical protein
MNTKTALRPHYGALNLSGFVGYLAAQFIPDCDLTKAHDADPTRPA